MKLAGQSFECIPQTKPNSPAIMAPSISDKIEQVIAMRTQLCQPIIAKQKGIIKKQR